jgi:acetyl esterase/lipase
VFPCEQREAAMSSGSTGTWTNNITYQASPLLKMDVHSPPVGPAPHPTVVIVSGGGWFSMTKTATHPVGDMFKLYGYLAVTIEYLLYPPYFYPTPEENLVTAVEFLRSSTHTAIQGKVDPDRIACLGFSASGSMASYLGNKALGAPGRVKVVSAWSGVQDFRRFYNDPAMASLAPAVLNHVYGAAGAEGEDTGPTTTQKLYTASSRFNVTADTAPTFLAGSTNEAIPQYEQDDMYATLQSAGVTSELLIVPGTRHAAALEAFALVPTVEFFDANL